MTICKVCGTEQVILCRPNDLVEWLADVPICWGCFRTLGKVEEWSMKNYGELAKILPICAACNQVILQPEHWYRTKQNQPLNFHSECIEMQYNWKPCKRCGTKTINALELCLMCRANDSSQAMFGKSISEMAKQ